MQFSVRTSREVTLHFVGSGWTYLANDGTHHVGYQLLSDYQSSLVLRQYRAESRQRNTSDILVQGFSITKFGEILSSQEFDAIVTTPTPREENVETFLSRHISEEEFPETIEVAEPPPQKDNWDDALRHTIEHGWNPMYDTASASKEVLRRFALSR